MVGMTTGGGAMRSRLVTVAHGTRTEVGNLVAREITEAAGTRLGITATCSFVELAEPLLTEVLAASEADVDQTLVVPLLLSTGFHLRQDLPAMVSGGVGPARLGRSLGPHRAVAEAQVRASGRGRGATGPAVGPGGRRFERPAGDA